MYLCNIIQTFKSTWGRKNVLKDTYTNLKNEYFLMGLRMIKGVSISKYKSIYNKEMFIDFPFINKFIDLGLLKIVGDNLSFTDKGLRLSNIVFREFVWEEL